jgi:uncharacterized protein YdiU (UPF0061 family)
LNQIKFANTVKTFGLPVDENKDNTAKQVRGFNFSKVTPTELANVRIASLSPACFEWLGVEMPQTEDEKKAAAELLSGNVLFEGSEPFSHCYCGH